MPRRVPSFSTCSASGCIDTHSFAMKYAAFVLLLVPMCLIFCGRAEKAPPPNTAVLADPVPPSPGFAGYWYQGKAELSTYDVEQERYGEMRPGEQIIVFVTEDFSLSEHVKLDSPARAPLDRVPVLKSNVIRRFQTGIYDYSLMQSVFTPVEATRHARTLKMNASIQDWCGQVFIQFNVGEKGYQVKRLSYFETEGDRETSLPITYLEDELWSRIRLNPLSIPLGRVQIVPAMFYTRFRHQPFLVHEAMLTLEEQGPDMSLRLVYENIPRQLTIRFERAFPHRILGWEETDAGKVLSIGRLRTTRLEPYWEQHGHAHDGLRDSLKVQ
jgi:hypothetical protein